MSVVIIVTNKMTNTVDTNEQAKLIDSDSSIVVEGMRFSSKLYNAEVIHSALKYVARADDIFIVTTPKSGTTWMQTIVYALLNNGRAFDENIDHYIASNPFLEMHGRQAVETMQRPGAIKTHVVFDRLPYHPSAKYICVIRNPKDVCLSFHRFVNSMKGGELDGVSFDTIFDHFVSGKVFYVDYFDHLFSCWSHKNDANVLIILYEDMKKDIRSVINRIATFLNIEINEKLLERVVTVSSFDYMKREGYNEKIVPAHTVATFKFLRKGIVGDWRRVLSNEQSRLLDARFREKTKNIPELSTLWNEYDIFDKE
jgi:hypothetical protein